MDPRVKVTPEVQQIFTLTTQRSKTMRETPRPRRKKRAR
jgi:hypothetical protein